MNRTTIRISPEWLQKEMWEGVPTWRPGGLVKRPASMPKPRLSVSFAAPSSEQSEDVLGRKVKAVNLEVEREVFTYAHERTDFWGSRLHEINRIIRNIGIVRDNFCNSESSMPSDWFLEAVNKARVLWEAAVGNKDRDAEYIGQVMMEDLPLENLEEGGSYCALLLRSALKLKQENKVIYLMHWLKTGNFRECNDHYEQAMKLLKEEFPEFVRYADAKFVAAMVSGRPDLTSAVEPQRILCVALELIEDKQYALALELLKLVSPDSIFKAYARMGEFKVFNLTQDMDNAMKCLASLQNCPEFEWDKGLKVMYMLEAFNTYSQTGAAGEQVEQLLLSLPKKEEFGSRLYYAVAQMCVQAKDIPRAVEYLEAVPQGDKHYFSAAMLLARLC